MIRTMVTPWHQQDLAQTRTINMTKQKLIDLVLDQIEYDIDVGDLTAIEELLKYLPKERLRAYLPEEIYG